MHFYAEKRFTDREELKRIFFEKLKAKQAKDEYRVITFYGVGGQGKSELYRYFQNKRKDQNDLLFGEWARQQDGLFKDYHLAALNFQILENRNPAEALVKLRALLAYGTDIPFFNFDLAFAHYLKSTSPNLAMRERYPELFRRENELLHKVFEAAGPVGEVISYLGSRANEFVGEQGDWYRHEGRKHEEQLKVKDQQELLAALPDFLGLDLKSAVSKPEYPRLAILLDTYEALWEGKPQQTGIGAQETDQWIRNLVSASPGVLFVIFGREKLQWDIFSKDRPNRNFTYMLEGNQYSLDAFSSKDAHLYLKRAGVRQDNIREKIVTSSAGLPFYLDLQVNTYNETVEAGDTPTLDTFGGTEGEVITCFLRHLNEYEENTLYILGQARQFGEDLFNHLKEQYFSGSPLQFYRFIRHSFIEGDRESKQYTIHKLMREHLQAVHKQENPKRYEAVYQTLFHYYDEQAKAKSLKDITPNQEAALVEAAYYIQLIAPESFGSWLDQHFKLLYYAGRYRLLEPLSRQAIAITRETVGEEDKNYISNLSNLAGLLRQMGRYREAEPLLRQSLDIAERLLDEENPDYATYLNNLAGLLGDMQQYEEAESLFRQTLEITKRTIGEENSSFAVQLSGLAGVLEKMERYEEAKSLFVRAHIILERTMADDPLAYPTLLNNFAGLLVKMKLYKQAEAYYRKALDFGKVSVGEESLEYAIRLSNLASPLIQMERYEEAEALLRQAINIDRQKNSENHPAYGTKLRNLAILLEVMECYEEADSLFKEAIDVFENSLGTENNYTKTTKQDYQNFLVKRLS